MSALRKQCINGCACAVPPSGHGGTRGREVEETRKRARGGVGDPEVSLGTGSERGHMQLAVFSALRAAPWSCKGNACGVSSWEGVGTATRMGCTGHASLACKERAEERGRLVAMTNASTRMTQADALTRVELNAHDPIVHARAVQGEAILEGGSEVAVRRRKKCTHSWAHSDSHRVCENVDTTKQRLSCLTAVSDVLGHPAGHHPDRGPCGSGRSPHS